jgi:hypothetical protein
MPDRRITTEAATLVEYAAIAVVAGIIFSELLRSSISFSSKVWPYVILALIGLVLLASGATLIVGRSQAESSESLVLDAPERRWALIAAYVAYVVLLPYLGFLAATAAFMVGAALAYGCGLRPVPLVLALATATAIYVTFVLGFGVPLPSGSFPM